MFNFKKKSVVSFLLAFVILFTSANFVFAADYTRTVGAPQELKDIVRQLEGSDDTIKNDRAIPDPGSEEIFKKNNIRSKRFTTYSNIPVSAGAELPVNPVDRYEGWNTLLYWNGANNNPTRISATLNGDPRTSIGFNWYTSDKADSYALVSKSPDMTNATKYEAVPQAVYSKFIEREEDGQFGYYYDNRYEYIYKANAYDLEPDTTYYYQVGSDAEGFYLSPIGTFKTAGNKGEDFSFIHVTDTQNWYGNQFGMDEAWYGASTLEEALKIYPDIDYIAHTGDIVEISESEDEWVDILEQSKKSLMSKMLVPASGNHDELSFDDGYSRPKDFNRHFNVPVTNNAIDGGSYYSYDYNGVHFIVANTNDYKDDGKMIGPAQREWIKDDVKKARENGAEWIILAYHKPLYSKSYHSLSDKDVLAIKQEMMEFIDEYDIDLCMQGHDHVLARTKSLKYTPDNPFYGYIADNGVNGENKLYKDTEGTIFVLPNMAGTKAYDDFYSKGLEHTKRMRGNLHWMTQEDLDLYNSLFALGGQPAQHERFATKYSNNRDSIIQNFAYYEFKDGDLHVKMHQVEGRKGEPRTTKVIDEFILSKTKYYDVEFNVDLDKATVSGETKLTNIEENTPVSELKAPKVIGKEGYKFLGWSPKFEGTINKNTIFTAIFEKDGNIEPTPLEPTPEYPSPIRPDNNRRYNPFVSGFFFGNRATSNEVKPVEPKPVEPKPVESKNIEITDIAGHWAEKSVREVVNKGYMELENGKFFPNVDATRLEYVKALAKLAKVNPKDYMNKTVFKDVKSGTTDAGYINWANEKGIIKGTGEGDFEGDRNITRQEIATILNRYEKAMNLNLSKKDVVDFSDNEKIADWAKEDVKEAHEKGIFNGKDNNMFDPISNITRAEVAQVVVNMDK